MTKTPRVSVIIPVRNEELRIKQCIEGILSQSIEVHEIIVIDSGSTDETLPILTTFPEVTLIQIDGSTFNHGLTRNLGVTSIYRRLLLAHCGRRLCIRRILDPAFVGRLHR